VNGYRTIKGLTVKKNLLATSALVAAGAMLANGAIAQTKPLQLQVGGYSERWMGFAGTDVQGGPSAVDFDVQEDSEIHFKGSVQVDNGLTFGVNVQLEGQVQGDLIDESYIFVRGSFGEILLGDENGAAYAMSYGPVSHGTGLESGDLANWAPAGAASFELHTTNGNFARRDNDSTKIRYISPRFSGFQFGASYAPEATQDDDGFPSEASNNGVNEEGVIALAANYDQKFGNTRVQISGAYQHFSDVNGTNAGSNDAYAAGVGARIGFGAFTVSGAYNLQNETSTRVGGVLTNVDTRTTYGASVAYAAGDMGVSLGAIYGQDEGATAAVDDEQIAVELGGKYKLGPGVEAKGSVFYFTRENGGTDSEGAAVVGGIRLAF
jgi:predicted porin